MGGEEGSISTGPGWEAEYVRGRTGNLCLRLSLPRTGEELMSCQKERPYDFIWQQQCCYLMENLEIQGMLKGTWELIEYCSQT